ncbi:MAG: peptidoglycan recognition family protein [Kiritimatiellae bacterium]|nr:peptidoglycan recognition family protein [Kiritimatiellia bacterium]MDD5521475.1 peptidoglycan recognition family protein [Kiritimatiellia bacterium]
MKQNRRFFIKSFVMAIPALLLASRTARGEVVKRPVIQPVNLDFIKTEMDIMGRDTWTNVLPRKWLLRAAVEFDRITVHHVGKYKNFDIAKSTVIRDLDGILTEHIDRNYGDIGYHFVIDYAGRLWEGRSLGYEGAHVAGQNDRNIGIVCIGNFDMQKPSEDQLITVEQIITVLRERYAIKQTSVFGHRDLGPSACPGDNLYASVVKLRE